MPARFRQFGIQAKIGLMGVAGVLCTAVAFLFVAFWQSQAYHRVAQTEVQGLIQDNLDLITRGVYNLVKTENDAFAFQAESQIRTARHLFETSGRLSFGPDLVDWTATNQQTGERLELRLPRMIVGDTWLGRNDLASTPTPVIDRIADLTLETATIFQRMNDRGDMLRVATTVQASEGKRAIGTFIPAINPDGSPNPVVSRVLAGQPYRGRAYVVNDWYLTAYEPLRDQQGAVVGMLYIGTRQRQVENRVRQAILQTGVGKTGYVYIIGATGETRGRYVVSQGGARDGENIWDTQDSDGRYVIREIVTAAQSLASGSMSTIRYRWQNPGEPAPRWKIARLAYFEPWNWVIGTSVYEDELEGYRSVLEHGRSTMLFVMIVAGLIIVVVIGLSGFVLAWSIAKPIRNMTAVARAISQGDLEQRITVDSEEEIGILGHTLNLMTARLQELMAQLRRSEEDYRRIFEDAPEGIFQTTIDGSIRKANKALARFLGFESPEALIIGVPNARALYVEPTDRDRFLDRIRAEDCISDFEVLFRRSDGTTLWVTLNARILQGPTPADTLIQGFIVDISARKKAEEDIRRINAVLQAQQETSPDGILLVDPLARIISYNRRFIEIWGIPAEILSSGEDEPCLQFVTSRVADPTEFLARVRFLYEHPEKHSFDEVRTKDGRILERFSAPMTGRDGTFYGRVWYFHDISERRQAEEKRQKLESQLLHSQKLESVGLLAGGIAHDFNNLLTPILGYSEMLLTSFAAKDSRADMLQVIKEAAERAKDLSQQLLAFSRKQVLEVKRINLGLILKPFMKILRRTIRENIKITVHAAPDAGEIMADIGQLEQIVMNLSVNAQDAMPEGGQLSIRVQRAELDASYQEQHPDVTPGSYVLLELSDTGTGMPKEILEHIFEPFFTTKETGRGTGLGLSTVYGITRQHGGHITVYSEPSKGTTFRLYFPRIGDGSAIDEGAGLPLLRASSRDGKQETILIVEDNELVRHLTRAMLEELGYVVLEASGGEECFAMAAGFTGRIHLLLSDVIMPGLNGREIYDRLRESRPDLKVIFMSGYPQNIIAHHGILEDGICHLQKPFTTRQLAEKLRSTLDTP